MAVREAVRESGRDEEWDVGCERPRTMGPEVLANAAAKAEVGPAAGMRSATAVPPARGGQLVLLPGGLPLAGFPNGGGGDAPNSGEAEKGGAVLAKGGDALAKGCGGVAATGSEKGGAVPLTGSEKGGVALEKGGVALV